MKNIELLEAINQKNIENVKFAINDGAYVSFKSDLPIMTATYNGSLGIVKLLIEKGARINIKKAILIVLATQNKHYDLVQYLFDVKINFIERIDLLVSIAEKNKDEKMLNIFNINFNKEIGNYNEKDIIGHYYYKDSNSERKHKLKRASSISKEKIDLLIKDYDISILIKKYINLKPKSKSEKSKQGNLYAICPFHKEKSPSLCVSVGRKYFHCFGCGESGNAIQFIMKYEKISFTKAVRKLSSIRGIKLK